MNARNECYVFERAQILDHIVSGRCLRSLHEAGEERRTMDARELRQPDWDRPQAWDSPTPPEKWASDVELSTTVIIPPRSPHNLSPPSPMSVQINPSSSLGFTSTSCAPVTDT